MIQNGIYDEKKFQGDDHPQHSMINEDSFVSSVFQTNRKICKPYLSIIQQQFYKTKEFDKFPQKNNNFDQILQKLEELEISLIKCQQDIIKKLSIIKIDIQKLKQKQQQQNQNELMKSIRINEFQQQLYLVWNMDTHQGTKEFELLEQQRNSQLLNWKDCCNKKISEISRDILQYPIKHIYNISSILLHFNDDIQKQENYFQKYQKVHPI